MKYFQKKLNKLLLLLKGIKTKKKKMQKVIFLQAIVLLKNILNLQMDKNIKIQKNYIFLWLKLIKISIDSKGNFKP